MRIAITPGEPAGIGPELVLRLIQESSASDSPSEQDSHIEKVIVASRALLEERAQTLKLDVKLTSYDAACPRPGQFSVLDTPLNAPCMPGQLNAQNSRYVLETLTRAAQGCLGRDFQALVTGPVHKGIINEAAIPFTGHTEFFAAHAGKDKVVMMLATEGLRVALVTTHLPLKDVPAAITRDELISTITILQRDLQTQFGIPHPRILVCGLNPHAGEGGHMGREEIDTITPTLEALNQTGMNLVGPLPADTVFTPHHLQHADAVLAMYHDQGLPTLKYKGFGKAVNITLGLPYIRTSVDHGTALDLVNTGKADLGSLKTALEYASNMISQAHQ